MRLLVTFAIATMTGCAAHETPHVRPSLAPFAISIPVPARCTVGTERERLACSEEALNVGLMIGHARADSR
jgi:hypothetical protein